MAEMRGRYLQIAHPSHHKDHNRPARLEYGLPLGEERSVREQAIQTEKVAYALAASPSLTLDVSCNQLTDQPADQTQKVSVFLPTLTKVFTSDSSADDVATAWGKFTHFLYSWDAYIQDTLAGMTFGQSSGYQLGRGLAEIYWSLRPLPDRDTGEQAQTGEGWDDLLGHDRQRFLRTLIVRLTAYLNPVTAEAILVALKAWGEVAKDEKLSNERSTHEGLREQVELWRDLLLTSRDPTTLVPQETALVKARQSWPALKAFWPQVAFALLGAISLFVAAALLTISGNNKTLGVLLTVLGAFGITSAALTARAKEISTALSTRLRAAFEFGLVRIAATRPPAQAMLKTLDKPAPGGRTPAGRTSASAPAPVDQR